MNGKQIICKDFEVRALLAERKTQLRRVITPQPVRPSAHAYFDAYAGGRQWNWWLNDGRQCLEQVIKCPFGQPGDLLWVGECFHEYHWDVPRAVYRADGERQRVRTQIESYEVGRWKPSTQMPRWASRLTLEVTDVLVERLQDISEDDAMAEGAFYACNSDKQQAARVAGSEGRSAGPRDYYRQMWDAQNAGRGQGWGVNPWVWVIEFKVHEKNIDDLLKEREA